MSRSELYLQHVLDAIGKVERYASVGHDTFMTESHWQDAIIRQLEIIGEAVKRIPPETQGRRPDIPWRRSDRIQGASIGPKRLTENFKELRSDSSRLDPIQGA